LQKKINKFKESTKEAIENKNVWVNTFINQMEYAYAAADMVISRSGAMSVAELCVAKKPVVFVPFPFAAEDHQTANAQNLVNKQAGMMIKDSEAKEKLVPAVIGLAKDIQQQNTFKEKLGNDFLKKALIHPSLKEKDLEVKEKFIQLKAAHDKEVNDRNRKIK
jgi:UDP-N-acetylglucosamine:LPS N-acetylglucosamine transferase